MTDAPKRRWFRFGKPWGMLAKTNRSATRGSVGRHGVAWAMIGATAYWLLVYLREWSAEYGLAKMLFFAMFFGFVGALLEWQIDDSDDEPPAPPATHEPPSAQKMIETKRTHQWLRFSLRTLFVFVTLFSVFAAPFIYRANKQRLTVARLEQLGAQVGYDLDLRDFPSGPPSSFAPSFGPQWLYTFMGVDYFRTANFLGFEGDKVKDEDLKLLNDLPNLVFLSLGECSSVTGGALYHLSNTPHLAVIVLGPQRAITESCG